MNYQIRGYLAGDQHITYIYLHCPGIASLDVKDTNHVYLSTYDLVRSWGFRENTQYSAHHVRISRVMRGEYMETAGKGELLLRVAVTQRRMTD